MDEPKHDPIRDRYTADWWYLSHLQVDNERLKTSVNKKDMIIERLANEAQKLRAKLKRLNDLPLHSAKDSLG